MITIFCRSYSVYHLYLSWWNAAMVGHTLNNNPREVLDHAMSRSSNVEVTHS